MPQIILTCGPACEKPEILSRMASLATGFRLNIAHLSEENLQIWLQRLQDMRQQCGRNFTIFLDLQGAKVRIGEYRAVSALPEKVELFHGAVSDNSSMIPVTAASVFEQTRVDDRLLLNDGRVVLKIIEKGSEKMVAEVLRNGPLSSGKGLNSPDRVFELARVTENDRRAIAISRAIDNVAYAVSFVADGRESELFRSLTVDAPLIAKIERRHAMQNLEEIDKKFAGLWFCRGDLGAEAGLKELGRLQREFVEILPCLRNQALIAGEVLGSMISASLPSRAEIVQLYDAMHSGFAGFVLSDETACGRQIDAVVDFLDFWCKD